MRYSQYCRKRASLTGENITGSEHTWIRPLQRNPCITYAAKIWDYFGWYFTQGWWKLSFHMDFHRSLSEWVSRQPLSKTLFIFNPAKFTFLNEHIVPNSSKQFGCRVLLKGSSARRCITCHIPFSSPLYSCSARLIGPAIFYCPSSNIQLDHSKELYVAFIWTYSTEKKRILNLWINTSFILTGERIQVAQTLEPSPAGARSSSARPSRTENVIPPKIS